MKCKDKFIVVVIKIYVCKTSNTFCLIFYLFRGTDVSMSGVEDLQGATKQIGSRQRRKSKDDSIYMDPNE